MKGRTASGRGRSTIHTQGVGNRGIKGVDGLLIVLLRYRVLHLQDLHTLTIMDVVVIIIIIDASVGAVLVLLGRMECWMQEKWLMLQMLLGHLVQSGQTVVPLQRVTAGLQEGQQERHVLGQVVWLVLRLRSGLLLYVAG